jgi:predicted HTH domain antitoxin
MPNRVIGNREFHNLLGKIPFKIEEVIAMNLELQIPEEIAHLLTSKYADLPRAAVEALALEGYRSKRLSEGQLRQMLGFSSRMLVHAFLKDHGVYLHYSLDDLDQDRQVSRNLEERVPGSPGLA